MRLPRFRTLLLAFAASALTSAHAERVGAEPVGDAAAITPPRLVHAPPVELPRGAAPTEPVSVELELTIDASGHVTLARVTSSGGANFDDQALTAARAFEFEPARRGAEAVAVTIGYRYVFPAVAPAPVPAEPATPPAAAGNT